MRPIDAIEPDLAAPAAGEPAEAARALLGLAEEVLEVWVASRGALPTEGQREGFRLLELHHQGAAGIPSFNACRETCREIAYHYNLLTLGTPGDAARQAGMMRMLVRHLALFVSGKLQVEGLGEFCCASKPIRRETATLGG